MFKSNCSTNFKTDKSKSEVFKTIEDNLDSLGSVEISDNGTIKINASKNNSFSHNCFIEGKIKENQGKYSIDLDIEVKPSMIIFLLIICGGVGLLLFALPFLAKSDLQKKADRVLDNIRNEFQ
jgi:hypothetical protein